MRSQAAAPPNALRLKFGLRLRLLPWHHRARVHPPLDRRDIRLRQLRSGRGRHRHRIIRRSFVPHQPYQQRPRRIARNQRRPVMTALQQPRPRLHAQAPTMVHPTMAAGAVRLQDRLHPGDVELRLRGVLVRLHLLHAGPREQQTCSYETSDNPSQIWLRTRRKL